MTFGLLVGFPGIRILESEANNGHFWCCQVLAYLCLGRQAFLFNGFFGSISSPHALFPCLLLFNHQPFLFLSLLSSLALHFTNTQKEIQKVPFPLLTLFLLFCFPLIFSSLFFFF